MGLTCFVWLAQTSGPSSFRLEAVLPRLLFFKSTESESLFFASLSSRLLTDSRLSALWPSGKLVRTLSHFSLFFLCYYMMVLLQGNPSSTCSHSLWHRPFQITFVWKFPILNWMLFFHPQYPVDNPASLRQGCFTISAKATSPQRSSVGLAVSLYIVSASLSKIACFMSQERSIPLPSFIQARSQSDIDVRWEFWNIKCRRPRMLPHQLRFSQYLCIWCA